MEAKFTPGMWSAAQVHGWGDAWCIVPEGKERPIATMRREESFYTEYPTEILDDGTEVKILSERAAREAGLYVPTPEHREEVMKRERLRAHLIAAAPDLYEALFDLLDSRGQLCETPESPEVEAALAALAKARGEEENGK
jgi:hypothetical protein